MEMGQNCQWKGSEYNFFEAISFATQRWVSMLSGGSQSLVIGHGSKHDDADEHMPKIISLSHFY
jgi:hypothetical protein